MTEMFSCRRSRKCLVWAELCCGGINIMLSRASSKVLGQDAPDGGGLNDLFVDADVNSNALLGFALEQSIDAPRFVLCRRATEVEPSGAAACQT